LELVQAPKDVIDAYNKEKWLIGIFKIDISLSQIFNHNF
jgi:hypothetical protein